MTTPRPVSSEVQRMREQRKANESLIACLNSDITTLLRAASMCQGAEGLDREGKIALREQVAAVIRSGATTKGLKAEEDTGYQVDENYWFPWMSCQSCLITAIHLLDRARVTVDLLALPPTDKDFTMNVGEASHWLTGALNSASGRDWDPA